MCMLCVLCHKYFWTCYNCLITLYYDLSLPLVDDCAKCLMFACIYAWCIMHHVLNFAHETISAVSIHRPNKMCSSPWWLIVMYFVGIFCCCFFIWPISNARLQASLSLLPIVLWCLWCIWSRQSTSHGKRNCCFLCSMWMRNTSY